MVEQLRHKERLRETFGRYVDPRVVEGLMDRQSLTAADGERRVMTVLFCDMQGFTSLSEGMTPQGLVQVMNHYLSTMSGPSRHHRQIYRRCDHGLLGASVQRERRPGRAGLPCRDRHGRAWHGLADRAARI